MTSLPGLDPAWRQGCRHLHLMKGELKRELGQLVECNQRPGSEKDKPKALREIAAAGNHLRKTGIADRLALASGV